MNHDVTKSFCVGWNLRFSKKSQGEIAREFEVSAQYVSKFKKKFSIERITVSTKPSTKPYQPSKIKSSGALPSNLRKPPQIPRVDVNSTINHENRQLSTTIPNGLNYGVLLTAVNNYLKGYKTAYENAKNDPLSETKKKYEEMLKQKALLEEKTK